MELATQRAIPLMSLPQRKLDSYWAKRLGFDFEETQWGDQYPVPHPEKKHQKISPITAESSNTEKFENMSNSESVGFNSVIRKRLCESPLCGSFSGNFNGSQTTNHFTRLGNQYLSPHQDSYLCDQQQNWSCDDNIYSARVEKPTSPTSTCSCMSDYEVFIDSEIRKVLEKEKMEKWMRNNNITHCHKDHTSNEENKCDGVSLDGEISGKSHNSTVTISDDEITDMQEVNINIDHNRERLYLNTNIPAIRGGSGLSVILTKCSSDRGKSLRERDTVEKIAGCNDIDKCRKKHRSYHRVDCCWHHRYREERANHTHNSVPPNETNESNSLLLDRSSYIKSRTFRGLNDRLSGVGVLKHSMSSFRGLNDRLSGVGVLKHSMSSFRGLDDRLSGVARKKEKDYLPGIERLKSSMIGGRMSKSLLGSVMAGRSMCLSSVGRSVSHQSTVLPANPIPNTVDEEQDLAQRLARLQTRVVVKRELANRRNLLMVARDNDAINSLQCKRESDQHEEESRKKEILLSGQSRSSEPKTIAMSTQAKEEEEIQDYFQNLKRQEKRRRAAVHLTPSKPFSLSISGWEDAKHIDLYSTDSDSDLYTNEGSREYEVYDEERSKEGVPRSEVVPSLGRRKLKRYIYITRDQREMCSRAINELKEAEEEYLTKERNIEALNLMLRAKASAYDCQSREDKETGDRLPLTTDVDT